MRARCLAVLLAFGVLTTTAPATSDSETTAERAEWINRSLRALSSPDSVVRNSAIDAVAGLGAASVPSVVLALNAVVDERGWDGLLTAFRTIGAVAVVRELGALSAKWPSAHATKLQSLYLTLVEEVEELERTSTQPPFPTVHGILSTFAKDQSYTQGDPRVARLIGMGPLAIEDLFVAVTAFGTGRNQLAQFAAADALSVLIGPRDLPRVGELLRGGTLPAARIVRRLPPTEQVRDVLLTAPRSGLLDADVLESLIRFNSDPEVRAAMRGWLSNSPVNSDILIGLVARFVALSRDYDAIAQLRTVEAQYTKSPVKWVILLAMAKLGDASAIAKLIEVLRNPPADRAYGHALRETREFFKGVFGEDVLGTEVTDLPRDAAAREALAARLITAWAKLSPRIKFDRETAQWTRP